MKIIISLLLFFVSLFGLGFKLNKDGFFNVEEIDILIADSQGQDFYLKPKIENLKKNFEKFRTQSLWVIDLKAISKNFEQTDWIEDFEVSRKWPSTLALRVRPKKIEALMMAKGSRLLNPIDERGEILSLIPASETPDVPILDGIEFAKEKNLRLKALDFLHEVPDEGSFSKENISEIKWSAKDGFMTRLVKNGILVKMGEDRFSLKSARVAQVLDYLSNRGVRAETIDANLSKKVLVKVQKGSPTVSLE